VTSRCVIVPCATPAKGRRLPRRQIALAVAISLLGHSVAFAYLAWQPLAIGMRWVPVQSGQASVELAATMAGGQDEPTFEPIALSVEPSRPHASQPVPEELLARLAATPARPREVRFVPTSAATVRLPEQVVLPEYAQPAPFAGVPRVEHPAPAESTSTSSHTVHQSRSDVGRARMVEMTGSGQARQTLRASLASQGAENASPAPTYNPAPLYPAEALAARLTGRVVLHAKVAADGRVLDARVYRSSGTPSLDAAAVAAVKRWLFTPAAGVRVLTVPIRFVIEE
jgi:TonB family protein